MAITLEQFAADCHAALKAQPGTPGRERVRDLVAAALADPAFVARYIPPGTPERHLLYEDAELGFAILAHGYVGPKSSAPHDHGPAWAIYGQAAGETTMTDWKCLAPSADGLPGKVAFVRDYVMKPGDAYLYDVGVVHSPERTGDTRLLRIEGLNMAKVKRFPYVVVEGKAAAE
jgi:hypothetical protein